MRVSALLMATFLSFSAAAGPMSYTEPFAPPQPEDESVVKLEQVEYVESAASLPPYPIYPAIPAYALSSSNQRSARIRYPVTDANSITVGFYSNDGCYAVKQGEQIGHGLVTSGYSGPRWPIVMDQSGVLYAEIEGQWYRRESTQYADTFCHHTGPSGPVKNLYLEITAIDSSGKQQILDEWSTLQFEPLMQSGSVYSHYEERSYEIPSGTEELILQLNSPWTRISATGEHLPMKEVQYPVLLTSLRIDGGADLYVGEKELPTPGDESGDDNGEEKIPLPPDPSDNDDEIIRIVGPWWDFSDPIFEEMLTQNEELMELVQEQQTDINKLQREKEEAEEKTKSSSSKSTAAKSSSSSKSASSTSKTTTTSKSSSTTRTTVAEKIDTSGGEGDEGTDVTHTREMIYSERGGFDSSRVYDVMLGICIAFGGLAAYRVYIGSVRK